MPVSLNIKHQLENVIKRFKFEELELAVLPIFPEFEWENIKSTLVDNHASFTTRHAVKIIDNLITKGKFTNPTLKDRLATLEVIDASRHYKKKVWYGYEFKGNRDEQPRELKEIPDQIKQCFKVYHMEMDVRIIEHNGIVFMSVKENPKRKPKKTMQPVFFALLLKEVFFFCSRKMVLKNILLSVAFGLGFSGCKAIKLMGKDIPSLIQISLARKASILEGRIIKNPLPFRRSYPVSTTLGLDFTQHKQRAEYANQCFGEKPPILEFLRVKCSDQKWKHKEARLKLPSELVFTGVEFRSPNLVQFLNNLICQRVLATPIPCYASNILTIGRNDLTMKES